MGSQLEHTYRVLLRAYPESYLAEREDEILTTLLDAARAGQRWPSMREAIDLVVAGLRTRAGMLATTALWLDGLRLGVLIQLAFFTAARARFVSPYDAGPGSSLLWVLVLAPIVLLVYDQPWLSLLTLMGAVAANALSPFPFWHWFPVPDSEYYVVVLAIVALILIAYGWRSGGRRPWALLPLLLLITPLVIFDWILVLIAALVLFALIAHDVRLAVAAALLSAFYAIGSLDVAGHILIDGSKFSSKIDPLFVLSFAVEPGALLLAMLFVLLRTTRLRGTMRPFTQHP